ISRSATVLSLAAPHRNPAVPAGARRNFASNLARPRPYALLVSRTNKPAANRCGKVFPALRQPRVIAPVLLTRHSSALSQTQRRQCRCLAEQQPSSLNHLSITPQKFSPSNDFL